MLRVVITGVGAVTPLGCSFEASWSAIRGGISGVGPLTRFDPAGLPARIAGEVKGFDPSGLLSARECRRYDPFIHYGLAAAASALDDAEAVSGTGTDKGRWGLCIGTARGGIATIEDNVRRLAAGRRASAYSMPASTPFMAAAAIAKRFGIRGPSLGVSTACASGSHAIAAAAAMLRRGEVDLAIAGGAEAPLTPVALAGYGEAGALSRNNEGPEEACRPFCRDRDGFVLAEGAAMLVLESLDHARQRGARIMAELAGAGTSSDAYDETRPNPEGPLRAIEGALREAGLGPDAVDAVSAHGTGTPLGDRAEAAALRRVFGRRMAELPLYAVKSMTGHLLGAAGALEAAVASRALVEGIVPPSRNFAPVDETLGVGGLSEEARPVSPGTILCNSFGFGGGNAAIVFRKVE